MRQTPPQLFESPKEQLFIERGCYTPDEFQAAKDKIGIPQGGKKPLIENNLNH